MKLFKIIASLLLVAANLHSQEISFSKNGMDAVHVSATVQKLMDKNTVKVIKDSAVKGADEPTFARIKGLTFQNGTIEVKVRSSLLKNAPDYARGFIGIAFRINESNSTFECIYLRPTNARATNQLQRNHSIQYFSYPDYKFERLRKDSPGEYESYTDMELNEWIQMKIQVKGRQARLFINNNKQPSLIVNDLKLGEDASGGIGLWVDIGTEGFFTDLKIRKE
jgi:hypothetical protein